MNAREAKEIMDQLWLMTDCPLGETDDERLVALWEELKALHLKKARISDELLQKYACWALQQALYWRHVALSFHSDMEIHYQRYSRILPELEREHLQSKLTIPVERADRIWQVLLGYCEKKFPRELRTFQILSHPFKPPTLVMKWYPGIPKSRPDEINKIASEWLARHFLQLVSAPEPFNAEAFVTEHFEEAATKPEAYKHVFHGDGCEEFRQRGEEVERQQDEEKGNLIVTEVMIDDSKCSAGGFHVFERKHLHQLYLRCKYCGFEKRTREGKKRDASGGSGLPGESVGGD